MNTLEALNSTQHQTLKLKSDAWLTYAATQHMMNVRVSEVAQISTSMPIFVSKRHDGQGLALSALTSLVPQRNLFVRDAAWQAVFQPISLRTYPLFLMQADNEKGFATGILADSDAFSEERGEPLFDSAGLMNVQVSEKQKLLESSVEEDAKTYHFLSALAEMNLLKEIDLVLHYASGSQQPVQGLQVINEEKLHQLDARQTYSLSQRGYLIPMHAMLISLLQLNQLVQRNNADESLSPLSKITLETARDRSGIAI